VQKAEAIFREGDEVFEALKPKGAVVEGFRREFSELMGSLENYMEVIVEKERDIDALHADITQVRDQASVSKRNIEETILSKENLQSNVEGLRESRRKLLERELSNRTKISLYSSKFDKLHEAIEVGSGWTAAQDEERQTLEKERDFLTKKLDNKNNLVTGVRVAVDGSYELIQKLENDIKSITTNNDNIRNEIRQLETACVDHAQLSKNLEQKVKNTQQDTLQAVQDLNDRKATLKSEEKAYSKVEKTLKSLKHKMDSYISEYDKLFQVTHSVSNELEKQKSMNRACEAEIAEKKLHKSSREGEISSANKEIDKLTQLSAVAKQKLVEVDELKQQLDNKRDELQRNLDQSRDHDLKAIRKRNEMLSKQRAQLASELEVLRKKTLNTDQSQKALLDLTFMNQNTKRNLLLEKKLLSDEVAVQYNHIQVLLQEKERHEHDTEITNQEYYTALEELKLQELQMRELQKKIAEDQAKLKHKQNLYEAVRADRNLYSKQLVESQEEISSLKKKFRLTNHQIDQVKEEISSKDHQIVKEHFHHHSVDKERELLKNELTKIRKQVLSSEQIIENQHVEVLKLTRIIEEADLERQRQSNELIAIISERNLLTAQVVKRNFELGEMYDKIKVQRSNLRIGEQHFFKILGNQKTLQAELVSVIRKHNATIETLGGLEEVKRKVLKLEKELLQEQSKRQALTDELARPMNVHRWRVLESSDPQRFERIRQIQSLQKELIDKADEVVEKDLLIQEKEKIYVELKNIISRQPGPEVEEQVMTYQLTLKDKQKQLSAMNNELDMYRLQVQTYKEEIEEIDRRISQLKKGWKKTKRLQNSMIQ